MSHSTGDEFQWLSCHTSGENGLYALNIGIKIFLTVSTVTTWKGKYQSMDNTKNRGKKRENSYWKMKRSPDERHTQTNIRKLNWSMSTITDVFLDQKRVLSAMCLCVPFAQISLHFSVTVFSIFFFILLCTLHMPYGAAIYIWIHKVTFFLLSEKKKDCMECSVYNFYL